MDAFKFQWDETLRTGDETLDLQHRELIHHLNLLLTALGEGQSEPQLEATLDFLDRYTARHFGYEECCMEQHRCPALADNRAAHAEFVEKFAALREQARSSPPGAAHAVGPAVSRGIAAQTAWLIAHILRIDTQLRASLELTAAGKPGAQKRRHLTRQPCLEPMKE